MTHLLPPVASLRTGTQAYFPTRPDLLDLREINFLREWWHQNRDRFSERHQAVVDLTSEGLGSFLQEEFGAAEGSFQVAGDAALEEEELPLARAIGDTVYWLANDPVFSRQRDAGLLLPPASVSAPHPPTE